MTTVVACKLQETIAIGSDGLASGEEFQQEIGPKFLTSGRTAVAASGPIGTCRWIMDEWSGFLAQSPAPLGSELEQFARHLHQEFVERGGPAVMQGYSAPGLPADALVVTQDARIWHVTCELVALEAQRFVAIGSGAHYALAAMEGHEYDGPAESAGQLCAVGLEIAARFDPRTGGTLHYAAVHGAGQ